MPLVNANCTNCGGVLQVDSEKEAWVCPYCKTPFIVDKAINNYNTTINNSYNIEHANITLSSKDFKIVGGVLEEYVGEAVDVVIPSSVREIASNVFNGMKIKSVKIPNTVEVIGKYAFYNCQKLESVVFDNGVQSIGEGCFANCIILNDLTLPDSLVTIEEEAFAYCHNLKEIVIPQNVQEVGRKLFNGCVGLKKITILSKKIKLNKTYVFGVLPNVIDLVVEGNFVWVGEFALSGVVVRNKERYCRFCGKTMSIFSKKCKSCGVEYV